MFVARYENTMRNARPKFVEPVQVRTMDQIRAERRARIEAEEAEARLAVDLREKRKKRHDEVTAKIERFLTHYAADKSAIKVPIKEILQSICDFHGVTIQRLMSRDRQRFMTKIRDEAIRAVADARPEMSLPELGRVFDGRDHTTILFSLRKTAVPGHDYRAIH
jgi:chromosomal replication initiation ATPase DnaA